MQAVCEHLNEVWDKAGYSMARMSIETGVPETTLRRARNGNMSLETAVAVARVLHVSLDELTGLMSPPAAAVVKEIEEEIGEELERKYAPHSEHCATSCPARRAMDGTVEKIEGLYRERINDIESLYERSLKVKNEQLAKKDEQLEQKDADKASEIGKIEAKHETRIARFRWGVFILLGLVISLIIFIGYLIFIDFKNPNAGILTTDLLINALEEAGYQIIAP